MSIVYFIIENNDEKRYSSLPKLKQEVERLLAKCNEELKDLPPPITNDAYTEIMGHITRFCTAFQGAVYGRNEERSLVQGNRAHYDAFETDIHGTAPLFVSSTHFDFESISPVLTDSTPEPLNLEDVRKVIKRCKFLLN